MEGKIEVFILFDKADRQHVLEFKLHLAPLQTQGLITVWDEDQIVGGTDRKRAIDLHLQTATLILLLVSARFMASPECYGLVKQALVLHTPPQGYVVPILLHEVDWEHSDLGTLKPLPTNGKPISRWTNRHAAYLDVIKGIRAIIEIYKQSLVSQSLSATQSGDDKKVRVPEAAKDEHESFATGQKPDAHVNHHTVKAVDILSLTIATPDGSQYAADVPADTHVDQLLRDFLSQWPLLMVGTTRSMRFSLRTEDSSSLDLSSALYEAGLVTNANLVLVPEAIGPNAYIKLMIEDQQREYYTTTVFASTVVKQLADAFLQTRSGTGRAVVEWILSATKTQRLRLEESLYNQGVYDDALLRIYRIATAVEE